MKLVVMKGAHGYRLVDLSNYNIRPKIKDPEESLRMFNDILDMILGYEDIKEIIRSSIQAISSHILFAGPPATAKTMFLEAIGSLNGAYRLNGESTTKAGLKDILLDNDVRYLIIDELEKMPPKDLNILLNAMDSQEIIVTQHEARVAKKLQMNVYGAVNRLDKIARNIPELKSRFMVLNLREYTLNELYNIYVHILIKLEGLDEGLSKAIAKLLIEQGFRDPRDARKVGKLAKVNPSLEFINKTIMTWKKYS